METLFILASFFLLVFGLLGVYDGFYLHLWKFELHARPESKFEHLTHTLRAVLFPLIIACLFVPHPSEAMFYLGLFFLLADVVVLAFDAWLETDSRKFMGGLPRWEYMLHLFVNGFHFSTVALLLAAKMDFQGAVPKLRTDVQDVWSAKLFFAIAFNLLPGALLIALLHVGLMTRQGKTMWVRLRTRLG
ncbi:MAG: hypothetical protein IT270_01645 [Saprospiraceae bacterium]|nr:hypothetical protein [Saprospiraceae bacterium]